MNNHKWIIPATRSAAVGFIVLAGLSAYPIDFVFLLASLAVSIGDGVAEYQAFQIGFWRDFPDYLENRRERLGYGYSLLAWVLADSHEGDV